MTTTRDSGAATGDKHQPHWKNNSALGPVQASYEATGVATKTTTDTDWSDWVQARRDR